MEGQGQSPQPNQPSGQNPANPNKKRRRWYNNRNRHKKNNPNQQNPSGGQPNNGQQNRNERKPGGNQPRPQQQPNQNQQNRRPPVQQPPQPPVVREYVEIPPELMPDRPPSVDPELIANPNNCPLCQMPVRSYFTALKYKDTGELAHFDCILRELNKEHAAKLGKGRRIYYIGGGKFALVKEIYDRRGHFKSYEVIEKFEVEPRDRS